MQSFPTCSTDLEYSQVDTIPTANDLTTSDQNARDLFRAALGPVARWQCPRFKNKVAFSSFFGVLWVKGSGQNTVLDRHTETT